MFHGITEMQFFSCLTFCLELGTNYLPYYFGFVIVRKSRGCVLQFVMAFNTVKGHHIPCCKPLAQFSYLLVWRARDFVCICEYNCLFVGFLNKIKLKFEAYVTLSTKSALMSLKPNDSVKNLLEHIHSLCKYLAVPMNTNIHVYMHLS